VPRARAVPAELDAWKQDAIAGLGEPRAASAAEARQDRRRVNELERELHRKDKALAETAALLVLSKKTLGGLPRRRGRMTRLEDRQILLRDIEQARTKGARLAPACALAGIRPHAAALEGRRRVDAGGSAAGRRSSNPVARSERR
jgi:hypothetical protein